MGAQDQATTDLFPLPQAGENFVLKREDIQFEGKLPVGGKLTGKGVLFLSSSRIVFLASKKSCRTDFRSFEIPLDRFTKSKFHQPIFGANYLGGEVLPPSGGEASPLSGGPTPVSLTFTSGGCGTFLPLFFQIMNQINQQAIAETADISQAAAEGRLNQ